MANSYNANVPRGPRMRMLVKMYQSRMQPHLAADRQCLGPMVGANLPGRPFYPFAFGEPVEIRKASRAPVQRASTGIGPKSLTAAVNSRGTLIIKGTRSITRVPNTL